MPVHSSTGGIIRSIAMKCAYEYWGVKLSPAAMCFTGLSANATQYPAKRCRFID